MAESKEKLIGEVLLEHNAVTRAQLEEALKLQKERGGRIVQILINLGYLTEERLLSCLGSQIGVSSVSLRHYTIDPELTRIVPVRFALKYEVMPLDKLGRNLTLAMAVPMDIATRRMLEEQTGMRVRAVLCSRSDVRTAIEQYYGVSPFDELHDLGAVVEAEVDTARRAAPEPEPPLPEDIHPGPAVVRLKNVTEILGAVDEFPLLPHVHGRIMQRIAAPDVSVEDITELIEQDPPLSANVLKLANSAAYAARHRFDSVQRAVAYIGLRELHSVVISSAVLQAISDKTHMDLDNMFQQSFRCGLLAKILSDTAKAGDRELAFTAGLLHDLGRIVLRYFSQERLLQIEQRMEETGQPRAQVEEEILGVSASEVSYHLLDRWNVPESLSQAIRFHDRLDSHPEPPPVAVAVALAIRCLQQDAQDAPFSALAEDGEAGNLLSRLKLKPKDLDRVQTLYREGLTHVTPLTAER